MSKVLLISHEFPPFLGGAGSVAEKWVKVLSENHDVTVVTRFNSKRNFDNRSFKLLQIRCYRYIFFFNYWLAIRKLFKTEKFDYILINDSGAAHVAAFFFNTKMKKKSLIFFHGNELDILYPNFIFNPKKVYTYFFNKLLHDVGGLVFVSNFLRIKILNKIDTENIFINKSHVIHPNIDKDLFYYKGSDDENHNYKKIKILTVTRVVEKKGLLKVIKILTALKNENINFEWTLIGDGPFLNSVVNELKINNLVNCTKILSKIDRNDLNIYYSNADVFILLSDFEESFGLVYLEANACGLPVIGNNKGGVSEVIIDNHNGFLVNNIEEAYVIISNYKFYKINKSSCINFSNKFNDIELVNKINNLFKSI
jgi:glycosyltransferase involved in cell wall biosynthesis